MTTLERLAATSNSSTWAWLTLVAATGIGWWFSHLGHAHRSGGPLAMGAVILTAFVKAWIVGFEFMELKRAPRWLRHGYDAWIAGMCATLLVICLG